MEAVSQYRMRQQGSIMKSASSFTSSMQRAAQFVVLGVLLLAGSVSGVAIEREWQWQTPRPQGCTLNAILGFSASDIFAVGDNGAIVHFDGSDWTSMVSSSGRDYRLQSLWGQRNDDLFAVGWFGQIRHYDGVRWTDMESGTYRDLSSVWGAASDGVFAVGSEGTILHFDGTTWKAMNSGTTSYLGGIWGASGDDVYAVGADGLILHYDGHVWTPMATPTTQTLYAVWGASPTDIFAVGNEGSILRLVDGFWKTMDSGTLGSLFEVWGWSSTSVYALETFNNRIHHFDGSEWNPAYEDISEIHAIWGLAENDFYTVGGTGRLLHSDGDTWTPLSSGNTSSGARSYLMSVWGTGSDNVFAVGAYGRIYHFDGQAWSRHSTPTTEFLNGVWGSSTDDVFAVGGYNDDRATILHFDGQVWSKMDPGTGSSLDGVWGMASDDVFAVGSNGAIVHYDGTSWTSMTAATAAIRFEGVWGARHDDVYAVGNSFDPQSGSIPLVYHWDGGQWQEINAPATSYLKSVWGTGDHSIFVGDSLGKVYRYDGEAWTFSGSASFTYGVSGFWGISERNLYAVGGSWGGTYGSGGIISRFDGSTWRPMTIDPVDPLYGVWGTGNGDVFAVGYNTTVLHHEEEFDPEILAVPSNLAFGAVKLGMTSDERALRVTNNGISWLEVESVETTGVDADEFEIRSNECSGTRLAPSDSCPVVVVFRPVSAGAKDAAISISSDDPEAPVVSARIWATGMPIAKVPEPMSAETD